MMKEKFLKRLNVNKKADATLKSIKYCIGTYQEFIGNKLLEDSTENDLLDYIQSLRDTENGEGSIALHKAKLRQFFAFCFEETDEKRYRQFIKLLKGQIPGKEISPKDILTTEEIKKFINVATLEQDRCIISVLYESGMRIGEFIALKISDVEIKENEVIFHIPNQEGCKTGSRTIPCLEVSGYVQDWLKCHPFHQPDSQFINLKEYAIRLRLQKVAERAKIKKPINPHNFRHSSITRSAMLGMTDIDMSYRFWGVAHSDMLNTYIHLSKEMNSDSYKRTMGMSADTTKIINPIAVRCVECGKLIPSGKLCKQCKDNKNLSEKLQKMEQGKKESDTKIEFLTNAVSKILSGVATLEIGNEILKDKK